jgi:hypothetical protein
VYHPEMGFSIILGCEEWGPAVASLGEPDLVGLLGNQRREYIKGEEERGRGETGAGSSRRA